MNSTSSTTTALNERRRLAVKLRLEGRKLKDICGLVDLSSPTIISAHKQFLEGGWEAVDVNPRGRPTGERTASKQSLELLMTTALDTPPTGLPPWSFELLGQHTAKLDIQTSPRTIGNYIEAQGLGAPSLYKQCKSGDQHTDWLNTQYKKINENTKKQNATVYWASTSTCQSEHQKNIQKFLYAHSTRGKYYWLAGDYRNDAEQFKDFFNRLKSASTHSKIAVIWKGHDPKAINGICEWLAQSAEIDFYMHPDNQNPDSKTTEQFKTLAAPPVTHKENQSKPDQTKVEQFVKEPTATPVINSEPQKTHNSQRKPRKSKTMSLTHLQRLEAESIHIMREVIAEADKPVMLYSIGKDSAVMLHLAKKAFYPAKCPFPLLHVDTGWKFQAMYDFRDKVIKDSGLQLIVHKNPEGVEKDVNPFTHGSELHTDIMKTQALKQALDKHEFDVAFGGARRDEEKSRAKERVLSFRNEQHSWDPKNQRPELWNLYNTKKKPGESIRAFPLSNWTELDVWQYIHREEIPVVPLYFAAERPVVLRDGTWIMVDDDRMQMNEGEAPIMKSVRFRTLGCYPLTGALESTATTVVDVIEEMLLSKNSEREGRLIDHDSAASMEKKKQEGYF